VYLAHIGVTDIQSNTYLIDEKTTRGVLDLAGAQANPFSVWVEDWIASGSPGDCKGCLNLNIKAGGDDFSFDLHLNSIKPAILQGESGFSRKGYGPGNATYYYSLTRLETTGQLTLGDTTKQVAGDSWMDHEWFSSVLDHTQVGWDWLALHLDDGRELMLFQVRPIDVAMKSFKEPVLVDQRGESRQLDPAQIVLKARRRWRSHVNEVEYPVHWEILTPELDLHFEVEALIDAQARTGSFHYCEGAVQVAGTQGTKRISGKGYLEMTGY